MHFRTFAAAAIAAASTVSAQTHSDCDPTKGATCPKDTAFGETPLNVDFTQGLGDLWEQLGIPVTTDQRGAVFEMKAYGQAPTLRSRKYLFFGRVDVEIQAAPGAGIVTSFVLQSDDLDEIDYEWIGTQTTTVQSNYFGKGVTGNFGNGGTHPLPNGADAMAGIHTYSIEWTSDYIRWFIDGQQARELKAADADGGKQFPQSPCQVKLGTWVAGAPGIAEGTVGWAGGMADFSGGKTYTAIYKSIKITDYSNGVKGAQSYEYKPGSDGSSQSITVNTTPSDGQAPSPASSPAATTSSSPSPSPTTPVGSSRINAIDNGDDNDDNDDDSSSITSTGTASTTSTSTDKEATATSSDGSTSEPTSTGDGSSGDDGDDDQTGDGSSTDDKTDDDDDKAGDDSNEPDYLPLGLSHHNVSSSYPHPSSPPGHYSAGGTLPSTASFATSVSSAVVSGGGSSSYPTAAAGSSGAGSSYPTAAAAGASGSSGSSESSAASTPTGSATPSKPIAQAAGCRNELSFAAVLGAGAVIALAF